MRRLLKKLKEDRDLVQAILLCLALTVMAMWPMLSNLF